MLRYLFIYLFIYCVASSGLPKDRKPFRCEKVNALYTWVDGSDPVHALSRAQRLGLDVSALSNSANRFRDMNGLMYSLRSIEKFAPWINKIFIYTANQIPSYVNTSHPKVHMLFHDDIFPNKTDLPTFNSNAIEASFPYLPDEVGPCFIYFNDDMFFGQKVTTHDFFDGRNGQKLLEDRWVAPASQETQDYEPWHKSVAVSNTMLDKRYGEERRIYTDHGPRLFNLNVLREMKVEFAEEFAMTMHNPLREPEDTAFPFLYHHYTLYNYQSIPGGAFTYWVGLYNDHEIVCAELDNVLNWGGKAICMNDQMDEPNQIVIDCATDFMDELFPNQSAFELKW